MTKFNPDPGIAAGTSALSEMTADLESLSNEEIIDRVLTAADSARLANGWNIINAIPCDHHSTRRRNNEDDNILFCTNCGATIEE